MRNYGLVRWYDLSPISISFIWLYFFYMGLAKMSEFVVAAHFAYLFTNDDRPITDCVR